MDYKHYHITADCCDNPAPAWKRKNVWKCLRCKTELIANIEPKKKIP